MTLSSDRPDALADASVDLARRLLASATGEMTDRAAMTAAIDRVCNSVAEELSRWFGPYGSLALVSRALNSAQREHPVLAGVTVITSALTQAPAFAGLADSGRSHSTKDVSEGVIAILAALAELIGRLIGDDLAVSLLEQSVTRGAASLANNSGPFTDENQQSVNIDD